MSRITWVLQELAITLLWWLLVHARPFMTLLSWIYTKDRRGPYCAKWLFSPSVMGIESRALNITSKCCITELYSQSLFKNYVCLSFYFILWVWVFVWMCICGTLCMPMESSRWCQILNCMCLSFCRCPRRPEVLDLWEAGGTGGYEVSDVSVGNWTQLFSRSTCSLNCWAVLLALWCISEGIPERFNKKKDPLWTWAAPSHGLGEKSEKEKVK